MDKNTKHIRKGKETGLYYTICINCGKIPLKAGAGSSLEEFCRRCGEKLSIEVTERKVVIEIIDKKVKNSAQ